MHIFFSFTMLGVILIALCKLIIFLLFDFCFSSCLLEDIKTATVGIKKKRKKTSNATCRFCISVTKLQVAYQYLLVNQLQFVLHVFSLYWWLIVWIILLVTTLIHVYKDTACNLLAIYKIHNFLIHIVSQFFITIVKDHHC